MRYTVYFIITSLFLISFGCTGIKSETKSLENQAMLVLVGKPWKYRKGVDVSIDDKINFTGEVVKPNKDRPKGEVYLIPTGSHLVILSYKGEIIYKKNIFISAQETRKIYLP